MKKYSIWLDVKDNSKIKILNNNINVDILIIGAGITGISLTYQLRNEPLKICVVDANLVGHGLTANTTGKITYLQGIKYSKLTKDKSKLYLESQQEAIKELQKIIKEENINCDFETTSSYLYAGTLSKIKELQKEKKTLNNFGIYPKEIIGIDFYSIYVEDTAVFHPLKYVYALKKICLQKQIQIYEKTKIINIKKINDIYKCYTPKNTINAKKVVIACHYPFFLLPSFLPIKTNNEQSYIMAYKTKINEHKSFISVDKQTKSYRFTENKNIYKIVLSNSHVIANHLNRQNNYQELMNDFKKDNPDYIWSNDDLLTIDDLPYISKIKDNLYLATGYNTWGMTNATIASKILKDLILNKTNKYEELFSLNRSINFKSIKNSLIFIYDNSKSFIENKLFPNKVWYQNVKFTRKNNLPLATVYDELGAHTIINRCPHMKCSLIYNQFENIWECPCHASKFDIDGKCLKGPSKKDISYKE